MYKIEFYLMITPKVCRIKRGMESAQWDGGIDGKFLCRMSIFKNDTSQSFFLFSFSFSFKKIPSDLSF